MGIASFSQKGVNVVAWQAQSRGSIADEAANPLHHPLKNTSLPHVV
jgi:hypothetical protein